MGKYTIISDVGNAIVRLLRENLCPQPIQNPDTIGLCTPYDNGNVVLGLYLYDIRESEEVRTNEMLNIETGRQKYPPMYLSLFYMLTAYSNTDIKFRASDDHRILGGAMQIINDNAILRHSIVSPEGADTGIDMRIQLLNLPAEEKNKLWTFPNLPYKLSLFYKVSPVELESSRRKSVQRVVSMDMVAKE